MLYINVVDDVSFQEHCLQIWIILLGFRDTNDLVNFSICKHEIKFTRRGYCRFTLTLFDIGGGEGMMSPLMFLTTVPKRLGGES